MKSALLLSFLVAKTALFIPYLCRFAGGLALSSLSELQVRQAASTLGLLVAFVPVMATAAPLTVTELMQMLGGVEAASARFVETRYSALLKSPLVLRGTLSYRRPDRVEKHVLVPHDERITVEGGRLTLENRAQNRLKTLPVNSAPGLAALIESIRATRAGDLAALQRYYAVQVEGSREQWTLTLKPLESQVADYVISIALSGSGSRIARITIEEAGGDRSVMDISEEMSGGERARELGRGNGPLPENPRGLPIPPAPPETSGGERAPSGKSSRSLPVPPAPPVAGYLDLSQG